MNKNKAENPGPFQIDHVRVIRGIRNGVRAALRRHKLLGQSIVVWRDGKVVEVPPEEIPDWPAEEESADQESSGA
jgi:hypothetical protein